MFTATLIKLTTLVLVGIMFWTLAHAESCHSTCYRLGSYTYCDTTCD